LTVLTLIIKGLLAGLAIAIPVGPVNVLVASRTLAKGRRSGLVSGAGAALADAFYGSIAGFSITFIIDLLIREEFWIRVVGGVLLMGIGVIYYQKTPQPIRGQSKEKPTDHSDFTSTLLLTLTNPTTVLSFLAVLAGLGMANASVGWVTWLLVAGIFSGSMLWWIVLVLIVSRLRDRFDDKAIRWMNRIGGIAIGVFGMVMLSLGLAHGRG
jgi:threonine/homoserine/homoserine lactone efflux protein